MGLFGFGKSYKPMENAKLLTTVYDFGTRSVVESILRDAEIPYILKDRGGSIPVITGSSMFGTDVFVNEADFDAANELIAPCLEEEQEEQEDLDEDTDEGN